MHSGPASSIVSRSPEPAHRAHTQSLTGMTTTRSGGFGAATTLGSRLGDLLTGLSVMNCAAEDIDLRTEPGLRIHRLYSDDPNGFASARGAGSRPVRKRSRT